MIVDKQNTTTQGTGTSASPSTEVTQVTTNALINVFNAVKKVLLSLKVNPDDNASEPLFKTVMMDTGQFARIVRSKGNTEFAYGFPAVFIHFINVRYLVQQQRIGEGRATLRIRYILNRLNNQDSDYELEGYKIFERINVAIQDAKSTESALNERCNLTYFDQPESLDNGLQPFWIDYEVWFKETSAYQYRNYITRYIVVPPFTNHSDQDPKNNTSNHPDHMGITYEQVTKFKPSVEAGADTIIGGDAENGGNTGDDTTTDTTTTT